MRIKTLLLAIIAVVFFTSNANSADLKTQSDSISYFIGIDISNSLKQSGIDVNFEVLAAALKDGFTGKDKFDQDTKSRVQKELMAVVGEKRTAQVKAQSEENSKLGKAYLETNKKKPGVKVTASGLQYEIIKEGNGPKPKATDNVKVHYVGTTIDGKTFDSSVDRGEPAEFPLNGVIRGWTEGVQLMSVGSKYRFVIPADLAYGDQGAGASIPAGATLIFEVELIDIPKGEAAPEHGK